MISTSEVAKKHGVTTSAVRGRMRRRKAKPTVKNKVWYWKEGDVKKAFSG